MKDRFLIGLDLGTSAVKGVLMSASGDITSQENAKTEYKKGPGGIVEFDAERFYMLVSGVIKKLAAALPEDAAIEGISMASASGNTLLVDDAGLPVIPAISWTDTRVTDEMDRVFGVLNEADVYRLIGWPLLKMFPLAHLSWIKCHLPDLLQNAGVVCMTTEYIDFRLTGDWGKDSSAATTFYLQDQVNHKWHTPFLQPPGTPVILGSFDHPCAARSAGVLEEGQMLISCGTSWVGFFPARNRADAMRQNMLLDPFLSSSGVWGAMFSLLSIADGVDEYICRYISDAPGRFREFDDLAAAADRMRCSGR